MCFHKNNVNVFSDSYMQYENMCFRHIPSQCIFVSRLCFCHLCVLHLHHSSAFLACGH